MLNRYWNHLWSEMSETGRKTFPWDVTRGAAAGTTATLQMAFALIIAIQHFDASTLQKSLIAGAFSIGLLLSPLYTSWSPILKRKTLRGALPAFATAFALIASAYARDATEYTCGMVAFGIFAAVAAPIMTSIWRDNYRESVRGQVVGVTAFIMIGVGLLTQLAGGRLLDANLGYYRYLFLILAVTSVVRGIAILKMPNSKGGERITLNPLSSFSAIWENPMFGYVLLAWFIMGTAQFALQPQRIEYLSQAQYGFELGPGTIVLIVGVTTEIGRLCVIQIWAHVFDRYNFIWIRIAISSIILSHVLLYYNSHTIPMLVLASALLGIAFGGGAIAWTLWVTKFAPPEETARYMSVHTFATGLRGSLGPAIGYIAVERLTIQTTSWIAAGMIVLSIAILWRIRNQATRIQPHIPDEPVPADSVT